MKSALVTGATRDIGRSIAIALAKAGWRTFALGRDRKVLDDLRADYGVTPLAIDLTDRDEVRAISRDLSIDALVHAALRWPDKETFLGLAEADIDMGLEVNLSAPMQLTHSLLPSMISKGAGEVVMILPQIEANRLLSVTVREATKAFAQHLGTEVSPFGVNITVIDPNEKTYAETACSLVEKLSTVASN